MPNPDIPKMKVRFGKPYRLDGKQGLIRDINATMEHCCEIGEVCVGMMLDCDSPNPCLHLRFTLGISGVRTILETWEQENE